MDKFDFFCFMKDALVAAQNAGWTHQPEYDRYIEGDMTLCFSKLNAREAIALDVTFDMTTEDVIKSGVAEMTAGGMKKVLRGDQVLSLTMKNFFDPDCINRYGEFKTKNYFMKGQDLV